MKSLLSVLILLPALASAETLWTCAAPANSFFTNPLFSEIPEERLPVGNVPNTLLSFTRTEDGRILGSLELSGPLEEKVENIETQVNLVSPETIGAEAFTQAVSYLKTMLNQPELPVDSYRSYPLPRPDGEIYLVGLDLLSQGEVSRKALLYPSGEIVGGCETSPAED